MRTVKTKSKGIVSWPTEEQPRERLLSLGPNALTDAELIAILIRVGFKGTNAVELARKHPKFEAEEEYRLFVIENKVKALPLKFRSGRTMLVPYLNMKVADNDEKMPIRRIIIGPTNHQTLSEIVVKDLLRTNFVECDVISSKIPYRANL